MKVLHKKNKVTFSKGWISIANIAENTRRGRISWTCSHLYNYCSNNPVNYVDPNGFAHFGKRPMKIFHNYWGIFASNPIDNIANTELCHEQLFYDDEKGGNLGFSWDGLFEEPNAEYKNII